MTRSRLFPGLALALCFLAGCGEKTALAQTRAARRNPDEEKLERVLASMSPRARAVVSIGDKARFLSDLGDILAEEKTFRADDKSLFFLIDKKHSVSSSYVPKDLVHLDKNDLFDINKDSLSLRPEAYAALKEMAAASLKDGVRLLVSSTYRSYQYQESLFNYWVKVDGLEEAERESARPGTSQHQLGTAVDFGSVSDDFDTTRMGRWMYANAARFGWSLSFPRDYEDATGYRWECWHFRYVGKRACSFQKKYFGDVQQFMLEFLALWNS